MIDIIIVSHERGKTWRLAFDPRRVLGWLPMVLGVFALGGAGFAAGYSSRGEESLLPAALATEWTEEARAQRVEIEAARLAAEGHAQALARRIAQLQARVIRLDAAGQRLTEIAGLEEGEFDFSSPPPVGGPSVGGHSTDSLAEVLNSLDRFEKQLSDRQRQMRVLEDLLLVRRVQNEVRPSGWPVDSGYISSTYGWRADPFSGRRSLHTGIDFAAREGADVLAVASGIVSDISIHPGYGKMLEINHGNGYVTRYAHNRKIVVQVGDRVHKSQRIALMGSTGRSSGPHVHFEVLLNGKVVNPVQYIRAGS